MTKIHAVLGRFKTLGCALGLGRAQQGFTSAAFLLLRTVCFAILLTPLVMLQAQAGATTTTVSSSLNPSNFGQSVTFTGSVTGTNPTGSVTFKDGTTTLGTGALAGTGNTRSATFTISTLTAAAHSITAVYGGSSGNPASTSAVLTQTVNKLTTTTTVTASINPSNFSQAVTWTATLSGGSTPSGSVTFKDGATTLGTGTISAGAATFSSSALTAGTHSIMAVYAGDTKNATSTSAVLTQIVNKLSTATAVSSSLNPSNVAQSVTLTATVTGGSAPTGSVTFMDGATTLGTGAISAGAATFSSSTLTAGAHSITAVYAGDTKNATSTSAVLTQTVNKLATATAVTASVNPSNVAQAVTWTATVTGGSAPTGSVTFKDGATTLGTGTISAGVATFSSSALSGGAHSITAVYGGDAKNNTSTSAVLTQTVNKLATTTVITASPNPSSFGQAVTWTATVSGGSGVSGSVTFKDGVTTLGTVTIAAGAATFSASTLSAGAHSITAVYAGDGNNNTSTSAALTQTVNKAATTTALASSPNPSLAGQTITLTATVTGQTVSGTVTFMDGATSLGSSAVSGGAATLSVASLGAGTHSVTAAYGGDSNNATSTSAALSQVVNPGASGTTIASSLNPSVYGQSVALTASVTGSAPTGNVSFKDGVTVLGTAALGGTGNTRTAVFNTSVLAGGAHSITAVYAGDVSNTTSTSAALTQTVNKAASSTVLNSSPNPSAVAQSVTLTATITGQAASGNVTFMDGATSVGSASVSAGVASLSVATLGAGSHNMTAVYAGDANNATSTSAAVAQVVNTATSASTLTSSVNPSVYGQAVTLTASITGSGPTGNVNFNDGATLLGTVPLTGTGNTATAVYNTSTLGAGTHSITASYAGDAGNGTSTSAALTQTVTKAATSTALASSVNPSSVGQAINLTATVTGQAAGGTVTFMDGATSVGSATLSGGAATLSLSTLGAGSHSLTAVYAGDTNNTGSTSGSVAQTVNAATSGTTLSSSVNPSVYGQAVNWTAAVTGIAPTGNVSFNDGATVLGTAPLSGSGNTLTATYSITALGVGAHSITAVYAGDASNATSTSPAVAQTVNRLSTTLTLTSALNPAPSGQSVTLTATVNGGNNPGGTITFQDGGTAIGTGTLSAGSASFTATSLADGTHTLTAVYAGDVNNAGSTSAALSQSMSQPATTTSLTSSLNPSTPNQTVTFTATVTGSNPSGNVTFKEGGTILATSSLAGGVTSFSTTTLGGGGHSITAVYSGDAANAASTSAVLAQTVTVPASGTTLSAIPSAATVGQNVTLVARITGTSPTGSVTFSEGGSALGTATVSGAAATLSLNTLSLGSHSVTVAYSGDTNNAASSSSAVTVVVSPRTGMTWQYGYDAMGRINTVVDPNGLASYTYYDSLGRPIQTQQPPNTGSSAPTVIQLGYDLADSVTSVTDPRNLATTYSPNGLGNVNAQSSPDSGASQYTYDANGNMLTSTDARGKQTGYAYDSLNRLTSVSYPTGTPVTFQYDGGATPTPAEQGELTRITDESGQTSYSHDALGRLIAKSTTIGSRSFTTGYSWGDSGSALDKLTAITYPGGSRVNFSYDAQGFVTAISVNPVNASGSGVSGTAQALLGTITYNGENKVTGWLWSDGKARPIGYDSVGQISSYSLGDAQGTGNAAGSIRSVTRDNAGRITNYTHLNNGAAVAALDQSFGYDSLNRLLTASTASSATSYVYDETGNRKSKTVGGTTYTNTVAPTSNRLTQTQDLGGPAVVTYDAAGHITGDGTNTYTYSDRGRMVSAITAGGTVTYVYNGMNQRVGKTGPSGLVPTGAAYYLYDEAGQLIGEYDANGTPVYETIYLGMMPVGAMKQTGSAGTGDIAVTLYNVNADHIATPRVITKQDETVVWRWDTAEAFGATAPDQNPSALGAFMFNQRFPGQVFDAETGLFQNWNREYNARTGRYVESDPIGLAGGINTFTYVAANPLAWTDLAGLMTTKAAAEMAFAEMKMKYPKEFGDLNPSFTTIPWLGNGSTLSSWVNINPLRYGFTLDCADLYQLVATVAHEAQHTRQSVWQQVNMRGITDDNYNRNDPHWKVEDRAHEIAADLYKKMKQKCECETK